MVFIITSLLGSFTFRRGFKCIKRWGETDIRNRSYGDLYGGLFLLTSGTFFIIMSLILHGLIYNC